MGKGDKKSKQGKRWIGSYGNSRNRKKIQARLKRAGSKKHTIATGEKPKAKKATKKKED